MSKLSSEADDTNLLLSPVPEVDHESSTGTEVPANTSLSATDVSGYSERRHPSLSKLLSVYVEVPRLAASKKAMYRPLAEDQLDFDAEFAHEEIDEIAGDVEDGRRSFYYVRYMDGTIHKIPTGALNHHRADLVQRYEQSKSLGLLPPFNPASSDVHPGSREAIITVKIPGLHARPAHRSSASKDDTTDDIARERDSEEDSDASFDPTTQTRTRATVSNKRLENELPFSPKKTRSHRQNVVVRAADSDSDVETLAHSTRRSTRTRNSRREGGNKKKIVRGKASRPAYGHFRVVADLQYDEEDLDDRAPLMAHRSICEKCHSPPAHEQLMKAAKKGKRRRRNDNDDDESEDEETRLNALGGWVRCLKCPVAAHWGCLAKTQRDEILRAALERDKASWRGPDSGSPEPQKQPGLDTYQTTEFICGSCLKGGVCMGCKEVAIKPDHFERRAHSASPREAAPLSAARDAPQTLPSSSAAAAVEDETEEGCPRELLFRCLTCKRLAHYAHLPIPDRFDPQDTTPPDLARYYQRATGWNCADCASFVYQVEHILAWRPYPENAVEPPRSPEEPINYKAMLPREYLVKWVDRSYRRVQWVPHGWLLAMVPSKLKNFLQGGTKVALLPEAVSEQSLSADAENAPTTFDIASDHSDVARDEEIVSPLVANPDAERKIPPAWKTVDRVLDIRLWRPRKAVKGKGKSGILDGTAIVRARNWVHDRGEEPRSDLMVTVEDFEDITGEKLSENHADQVAWAFFKWQDLGYDDASWDAPPRPTEAGYFAYRKAFQRYLLARSVIVPRRDKQQAVTKGGVRWLMQKKFTTEFQPQLGQSSQLQLMPFQVDGVNWLCHNWNISQNCILADEMGLGKTVQMVTFIGYIASAFKCYPALVVVPNSTITNWVREFERWAPNLRVVPFYGEAKAREVIKRYELFHSFPADGTTGAKYHVLVTTYETVTNPKEFTHVFKSTPRWEVLVVDEGQRLKSDASLIFKRLKELNSFHRVIMTGTPLNNNIRELFNLMNFLDPEQWKDLEQLSKQYEELTDELVKDLHIRLKPYFLRRIKSEVLQLPPKNEVIVPVSMAPLQKEIYRSILSQNLEILRSLAEGTGSSKGNNALTKTNMNNMLMQLRKCIQHPYLVSDTIEPRGLSPTETHERLVAASAKLRLLKMLLPKLRARGHRVLLFSQFVIALDIIEDFLIGEGIKYLRLDGNTKQAERQKGMDEFNKPDSDIFIYLLTTRAGGVGINLWSADTVIIFDPDFNPHQAIARAHRYGQEKTVLVFKLMVKDSAEERIMQTGKKKLVLDHLIVQKMDDESGTKEDVQSILMFGAKALFEENEESAAREIHYSEHDIDSLIEKTEKEGDQVETDAGAGSLFSFAKVWSAEKEGLEELPDEEADHPDEADSWVKALQLIATERAKEREQEVTGRGVRRRAAAVFPQSLSLDLGDTPTKEQNKPRKRRKWSGKSAGSDDSDFHAVPSDAASESDDVPAAGMDIDDIPMLDMRESSPAGPLGSKGGTKATALRRSKQIDRTLPPIDHRVRGPERQQGEYCGLCGNIHPAGQCSMTESPENLAQYRLLLMQHAGDETIEERRAAIRVIDETLHRLGKINLIYGQPLHLVEAPPQPSPISLQKKTKVIPGVLGHPVPNGVQPAAGPSHNGVSHRSSSAMRPSTAAAPNPPAIPRFTNPFGSNVDAIAGSSEGSASLASVTDIPKFKKAKETVRQSTCVVCGQAPLHLIKDCPVVAQGPVRIAEAILRLSRDPTRSSVVEVLRSIMAKQQRRAAQAALAPSGPVIDLGNS
ncbi:SNF2 family N-terminal domain-containing protein [Trametes punicea]|nr:SNF2 family N-terminal domain-containing protein [Trametes punicea]